MKYAIDDVTKITVVGFSINSSVHVQLFDKSPWFAFYCFLFFVLLSFTLYVVFTSLRCCTASVSPSKFKNKYSLVRLYTLLLAIYMLYVCGQIALKCLFYFVKRIPTLQKMTKEIQGIREIKLI